MSKKRDFFVALTMRSFIRMAMTNFTKLIILLLFSYILLPGLYGQSNSDKEIEIGIDEKLGQYIPMDLEFIDESGQSVSIGELTQGKPFVLSLVYYECPAICGPLLNGIAEVVDRMDLEPGKDYYVITISIDPDEDYELASGKKRNFMPIIRKDIPESGWRFLTGSEENIKQIADAIGFRYKKQEDGNFAHAGAIISVSPNGMVARYLYGITYLPFDLKMALVEASKGKVGPTINKLLRYCFSYDPQGRKYTFNILRVSGVVTTLFGLSFFGFIVYRGRKIRESIEVNENAQRHN